MFSKLKERIVYFFFHVQNDWQIGIAKTPVYTFLTNATLPSVKWLPMPRNVFRADPFGISKNGKYYIYYEEYNYIKGYGTINCMVLSGSLEILEDKVIIDEGIHFSFPYLISYNDELYMLPETCQKGELAFYKCAEFPYKWQKHKVVLTTDCMDSTLFFKDSQWWLFYNVASAKHGEGAYCIRTCKDLFGDWQSTDEQVVKDKMYNGRGGGNFFELDNNIYRTTQNCVGSYGKSVVINKITNLAAGSVTEEAVREITDTSAEVTGFHTLSSCGDYTLVDRRKYRYFAKTPSEIFQSLKSKIFK